jgi:hypothetical protein
MRRGRSVERERAGRLARDNLRLAREMGTGRPDLPGAHDAGLVDVNNVPSSSLVALLGLVAGGPR